MGRVIFLLEEPSMKAFLDGLIPRLFPALQFACVPHEGKYDLEKSVPRKLRAWREPDVLFVIVQDNDNGDCLTTKQKLLEKCREGGREDALVRIVCQELEAWYLGEPAALARAFADEKLVNLSNQPRYRDPDSLPRPSRNIKQLVPGFQKNAGARAMADHLSREGNSSTSFAVFLNGIERLCRNSGIDLGPELPSESSHQQSLGENPHQLPLI